MFSFFVGVWGLGEGGGGGGVLDQGLRGRILFLIYVSNIVCVIRNVCPPFMAKTFSLEITLKPLDQILSDVPCVETLLSCTTLSDESINQGLVFAYMHSITRTQKILTFLS